jgi:hypothetical protein
MPRGLIAALVTLLLGITPSLALACDARCLDGYGAHANPAGTGADHAGHSSSHRHAVAAHGLHADLAQPSDAASAVHVTTLIAGAAQVHHGCQAAFEEGTVDRQPPAANAGDTPARPAAICRAPSLTRCAQHAGLTPSASGPGRASIPLRI